MKRVHEGDVLYGDVKKTERIRMHFVTVLERKYVRPMTRERVKMFKLKEPQGMHGTLFSCKCPSGHSADAEEEEEEGGKSAPRLL